MTSVTQCPQCSTHFKVVPDQLRISEGWVRCGRCGEVFDARTTMRNWEPAQDPQPAPGSVAEPDLLIEPEAPWAADSTEPVAQAAAPELDLPATDPADLQEPPEPGPVTPSFPGHPADAAQPQDLAFVRQARRQAFWRRTSVRVVLSLVGLVLLAGLGLQVAVHERNRLVAAYPETRPWVQALCEPLGCQIGALQQIDAVLIDSSALVRVREGVYRFEASLKNTSALALAVPAVELSLTNASDDVVVRRVVLPHEWSQAPQTLAPRSELALSVRLSLVNPADMRMAGYRAVAFYP